MPRESQEILSVAIMEMNTKIKLLGWSALLVVGQTLATALGGPASGGVLAANVLSTIAASVAGNMTATELGNYLVEKLTNSDKILHSRDLTEAAGEAISLVIIAAAKSDALIEIAERKKLPYPQQDLCQLAGKTADYWLNLNTKAGAPATSLLIPEAQLAKIFSPDSTEFATVTGSDAATWENFLNDLARSQHKTLDCDIIKAVAGELHATFPRAFRQVLKRDSQAFAGMLLELHTEALGYLQQLGLQAGEILGKLQGVATQDQMCQLIARLDTAGVGIRTDLAEIREVLEKLADTSAPRLPLPYECETIIQEKTRDFVGRKFVFAAIQEFVRKNPKGYFILEGEPGVGKSAIMAMCVLAMNWRCVAHFNVQSQGITRAEQFLENVCTQLVKGFQLDYTTLPANATADGNFLARLLGEVSAKLGGKKLVIVVDALDEVDLKSQTSGSNVLYLPHSLPDGVYFIVSKRPQTLPLHVSNELTFDLMEYPAESLEDVKSYIQKRTGISGKLQEWVASQGLPVEAFVTAVAEKSENNFMYLRYVLEDIEKGAYRDLKLENLPKGLEQYYERHWGRMGMMSNPLPMHKVAIVYVLAQAGEPVSRRLLAKLSGEKALTVQQVLDEWKQFLRFGAGGWRNPLRPLSQKLRRISSSQRYS
ncbi:MAG: ATP-binding protein [Oscillatoria sp. Prado101]|jgi:hypothetical protein|nr:ATP-binding protein [Oscillatoria sp. Prado101]